MLDKNFKIESDQIKKRYDRRKNLSADFYNILQPDVYKRNQEFERTLIKWLKWKNYPNIFEKKIIEIGSGNGGNLLKFVQLGFQPENIIGSELLQERVEKSKKILPKEIEIIEGDALELKLLPRSFDIVFQSTVFTSILNSDFQIELAGKMWNLAKPEGGILWYDFIYDNPKNKDVKGIPIKRIIELFPEGKIKYWRLTLAPPISRRVTKIHPNFYNFFNLFPFLRTHVLCWIEKK
ncbi:MAG: class I SAM-dependent methyltransferase [Ignavibacteriaceae bacterium]